MMDADLIELSRCRDRDTVAETKELLDKAGIPCSIGSTAPNFDLSTIGSGNDAEVIISVRRADFSAARAAMEEEFLKVELPADHYLTSASDDELIEILGKPTEWSPFDVAHARKLAEARKIDSTDIERKREERMEMLKRGKPASLTLLLFGWIFTLLGGLIGLGIAWSICFMKEKTPEGDFFTYDKRSRKIGIPMFVLSFIMTALALVLHFTSALSM